MDLQQLLSQAGGLGGLGGGEAVPVDNSETVYISSLALLKMLKHGRAGVPMEVVSTMSWRVSPHSEEQKLTTDGFDAW